MKSKSLLTVILFFMFSMAWAQGFKISGTQLLDANGNNFIIKGVNVPLAWFVTDVNNNIAAIKTATGSNCMRIVVTTTTADNAWQTCVQKCIDNKIIPLIELHDVTGNNTPSELNRMAQFWASKSAYLTRPDIAKYILINIANEWSDWNMSANATGTVSRVTWRDAYITAVKTMRDAGIKTTLVIDAAGYGQDNKTQTILSYAKAVQASDPYHNCLFSVHMYCEWSIGGNSNVSTLLPGIKNAGIPIIVGEFGWEEGNGNGGYCNIDESLIINTANTNGIGWIAWSWKGNGGVENVLDLSNDWAGTNLTAWGKTVTSGTGGTKTAITASVFNATANSAPSVSITAPITNTTVSAPATIIISANASDIDGTISSVQFYNGTTLLNTYASAPYNYSWTNVPAGNYSITAIATDNLGASTTSAAVNITITATVTPPSNNGRALSNAAASPEAKALYCYIQNLSGKKILSGQMWSGWGFDELAYIQTNTGKQPAIMGLDFIQESVNNTQVQLATNYWKKGGIPTIMWHWGAPSTGEGYPASQNSIDINKCFQVGTPEYTAFWAELKTKADHLQALRDAGIPVLWRPFHELNGGWFWWSKGNGTPGETAANKAALFKKLWTTMYDYFVNTRQLNNLVWVLCYTGSPDAAWFPGNQYVDIAGGDEYASTNDPQLNLYNNVKKAVAPNLMPTTLHECGIPPDPAQCISKGSMWSWFMEWHTSYIQGVDKTYLNTVYNHDLVITLDEVGNIMTACGNTACVPTPIVPYMQTDGTTWVQQSSAQLCVGSTVSLGPQPSVTTGWTWTGPGNFTATTREITLSNITVAQGGIYTATYINTAGCSSTAQITVTVKALPTAPSASTQILYCQNAQAAVLTAVGTGLKWYTAAIGGTALATAPTPITTATGTTNYYVSQTTTGCESARAMIAVTINALPIITQYSQADGGAWNQVSSSTVCASSTIALGPQPNVNTGWSWSGPNGYSATTREITLTALATNKSGSYTATYTDGNSCKATGVYTLTVNTAPFAPTVTATQTYCQNGTATALSATGTGLLWYTAATGGTGSTTAPTPSTSTTGATNYYVSQTTTGCESARAMIAVTVTNTATASITTTTTTFCTGGSVVLTASLGSSYKWFNGTTQVGTNATYTASTAGAYSVEVTNASGCKATSAVTTITVSNSPIATITAPTTSICSGSSVTLTASLGSSYKWFNGTTQVGTNATYTASTAGAYSVEVTNASGCKAISAITTITVSNSPIATITAPTTSICSGSSVILTASLGSSYKWFNGATQVGTNATYTATTAGAYTVEVTNASGCKATSAITTIIVSNSSIATITAPTTSICSGSSVTLTASTGASYKWFNGTTQVGTNATYTAGTAGAYSVEVTNASGCKATSTVTTITVSDSPIATISAPTTSICSGSSVTLTASTGASYKWFNGTTQVGTNATYTAGTAGAYSVEVTNAGGCKATSAVTTITVSDSPIATISAPSTSFCNGNSVMLTASVGSSYQWYNSGTLVGTNQINSASTPGNYVVEVINASGCKSTSAVTQITVTNSITWYADADNDGKGDPSATLASCTQPSGYVSIAGDACPTDPNKINPGNCGCGKTETSCLDCAGVINGTASIDVCNRCSGGTTGITAVTDTKNCTTTGIVDLTNDASIKILPNPSSEEFTLILTHVSNVQILTVDGKLVETFQDVTNQRFGTGYAKGVYIVQISTNNATQLLRVIKL
jgi:hypothetical protein